MPLLLRRLIMNAIIEDNDYPRYIADKEIMLKTADEVREDYLKMLKEKSTSQT